MNTKTFLLGITILFFEASCSKEIEKNCFKDLMESYKMVEYTNQEINCNFYFVEYKLYGKSYYLLDNGCADMIAYPIDCEGNQFYTEGQKAKRELFLRLAIKREIVAISTP